MKKRLDKDTINLPLKGRSLLAANSDKLNKFSDILYYNIKTASEETMAVISAINQRDFETATMLMELIKDKKELSANLKLLDRDVFEDFTNYLSEISNY